MQNVPNIVRERLKVAAPAVNHPDADVLAAFSEQSLSELDRATVLEHLSRCADCREVVSLSLPPSEVSETVFVPSRAGWLAWPALRWGFVSAGILLVATLGVLQYRRAQSTMTASRQAVPTSSDVESEARKKAPDSAAQQVGHQAAAVAQVDEAQNSRSDAGISSPSADKSLASPKPSSPARSSALARAENPIGGPSSHGAYTYGPKAANQQQQNANAYQAQASVVAGTLPDAKQVGANVNATAPSPISVQGAVIQKEVASNEEAAQDLRSLTNAPISEPSGNYGSGELKIDRAKPAETTVRIDDSAPRTAAGAIPFQAPVRVGRALAAPRWSITSSGALQRSFDQGNTWQDVNVSNSARSDSFHGAASLDLAAKTSTAKAKDVERDSKADVSTLTFRAVVANGAEVWAGGSAGMLYHSVDSGVTWLRIVPSSSGSDLTGDIVSIQFSDGMHGRVITSTPEVWITSDSGQTWQK
jgi:hypothetical protein